MNIAHEPNRLVTFTFSPTFVFKGTIPLKDQYSNLNEHPLAYITAQTFCKMCDDTRLSNDNKNVVFL